MKAFEIAGVIEHGAELEPSADCVALPAELVEKHELLYRVFSVPGFFEGDILIVEPRARASTGELVLATKGGLVFVGRWWAKHGLRQVRPDVGEPIDGCEIAGAVNQLARGL